MIKYNQKNSNCCPPCPPVPPMPPCPPVPASDTPELVGVISMCGEVGPRGFSGAQLLMKDVTVDGVTYSNVVYLDTNEA